MDKYSFVLTTSPLINVIGNDSESSAQNEWHLFVLCRGNKKLNVGSFNYSSQSCSSFNALFFDISLKGGVLKNMTVRLENRGK